MYTMNLRSLNFGLDETLVALQDSVAAFSAKEIAPIAQQVDQDNKFPAHLWKKFGDMGLLGLTVSEEYGGTNLGYLAHIIAMQEISRAIFSVLHPHKNQLSVLKNSHCVVGRTSYFEQGLKAQLQRKSLHQLHRVLWYLDLPDRTHHLPFHLRVF